MNRARGSALARAGYALAGTLVAVLAAWLLSLFVPSAHPGFLELFAFVAAMNAVLMLWAAFKPSRGTARSVALEALVVFTTMMLVQVASDFLRSPSLFGYSSPLVWLWSYLIFMVFSGLGLALPAAWAFGSSERWARRSWGWVAGEAVFVLAAGALASAGMLDLSSSLAGFAIQGLVFVAAALAAAGAVQRLVCELVWRSRGERAGEPPSPPAARPTTRPVVRPDAASRSKLRTACIAVLVVSVGVSVAALAFFFACRQYAFSQGLALRNVVYEIPSVCIIVTCFVVVPVVAVGAARSLIKDYRLAGCAVLCALALVVALFFTVFRLDAPQEAVLPDGTIEVTTPVFLDKSRVTHAVPVGLFFMRMLPDASEAAVPEAGEQLPRAQSGHSYHTTGTIASVDTEAQTLELAVTDSTEDLATGERVTVECATAEHFDVPFDELEVGASVQIRSTEACADGVIVAQKVFGPLAPSASDRAVSGSLDDILASYDCPYAITGTVTSAIGEGGFSFRVDDGGGFVENGTELHVSEAFVERRLYGMKGLQWGMDGVVIGFSDLPAEGVLRAKVIVGNDDTSSDYWESMPAA